MLQRDLLALVGMDNGGTQEESTSQQKVRKRTLCYSKCSQELAASACQSLLEMQALRPHLSPTELDDSQVYDSQLKSTGLTHSFGPVLVGADLGFSLVGMGTQGNPLCTNYSRSLYESTREMKPE
jgi:hypothetical protein